MLENFISVYCDNTKSMNLITSNRLSNISTNNLLATAKCIKRAKYPFSNLQEQEKEPILNKILNILTNRDFKFEDYDMLENFISVYCDNTKAMDLITPDRLSNINTENLLQIAEDIKRAKYPFSNLQEQEKELILNKILNIITDRDFKFDDDLSLSGFIFAYRDNTKAMDLITSNRVSNIDTGALLSIAEGIKNGWGYFSNLQEQEKELILNRILNIITDRDFKFDDDLSLSGFIFAYRDNTKAMDLITSDKLSNIPTEQLESIVNWLSKCLPCANPSEKANIQRVIDIIDQKLNPLPFLL